MKLYSWNEHYKLYHWNMLDMLEVIEENTIDSIVTDPPYWLTSIVKRFGKEDSAPAKYWKDGSFARLSKWFMGKEWDWSWIEYNIDAWRNCRRVLKPWGYLLAFWGSRTFHRIACAIEDAGFEIRDCIMWLYGSWFPKSMNIWKGIESKLLNWTANPKDFKNLEWEKHSVTCWFNATWKETWYRDKEYEMTKIDVEYKTELWEKYKWWGTALKPSYEPVIVARKPLEWSCTDNVIKYGVGGINIDECRVWTETHKVNINDFSNQHWNKFGNWEPIEKLWEKEVQGRFPANTILTYDEIDFDEVCGGFPNTKWGITKEKWTYWICFWEWERDSKPMADWYWDSWSACRYFYCAKASRRDRDEWLDGFEAKTKVFNGHSDKSSTDMKDVEKRFTTVGRNSHPTVKPTSLMQYLVRLVTPNGWTVLDPFNWSWSTGKAVMYENKDRNKNYKYIWIELTDEYLPIAKARIEYAINSVEEKSKELDKQQPLFEI